MRSCSTRRHTEPQRVPAASDGGRGRGGEAGGRRREGRTPPARGMQHGGGCSASSRIRVYVAGALLILRQAIVELANADAKF